MSARTLLARTTHKHHVFYSIRRWYKRAPRVNMSNRTPDGPKPQSLLSNLENSSIIHRIVHKGRKGLTQKKIQPWGLKPTSFHTWGLKPTVGCGSEHHTEIL